MAVSVAALGLTMLLGGLDPLRVASGVYRTGRVTLWPGTTVPYLRDGKTATVALTALDGQISISTNGKPDAALQIGPGEAAPDEPTMVLLAAIPLSLHPTAARVANIGFGSGLTSHNLLASPQLQQLDTIELEPRMVEAARQGFSARTHNVFEDPRSHIIYEDAKTYFAANRAAYDLIISEPSNPWVSGVSSLFSDEFYGRVVQYLRPDGYFAQWLQIYETDVRVVASIIKALSPHFGAYQIYNLDDKNILIVATRSASFPAPSAQVLQWPLLRAELDRVGVQSTADMQWRLIGDGRTLDPLFATEPAPANSDYFPYVDLNSPRLRFLGESALALPQLTLLPAPFLGLLRADEPTSATLEPSRHSFLQRDQDVRHALAIHRAMSAGRLDDLDAETTAWLRLLDASRDVCAVLAGQKAWTASVQTVSSMTAPYLNPSELADLWKHIKDTPCYHATTGDQRSWADLLAAVAARDTGEIVKLGGQLLQQPATLNKRELDYLTTVVAAAMIRRGQTDQARALLAALWNQLDHAGPLGLPLQALFALAANPAGRALAQARDGTAGVGH